MKLIYIRTSTVEQEPQLQLRDIRTFCGDGDFKIFEEQRSAWKDDRKRTEWQKVVDHIKNKQVSDLYVWAMDRMYRNQKEQVQFYALCKQLNCKIHIYNLQFLETIYDIPQPWGEMVHDLVLKIFANNAEAESKLKSARIKNAVCRTDGSPTISYKGNKWGRKGLSTYVKNKVIELRGNGFSLRQIRASVMVTGKSNNQRNISLTGVRKILSEYSSMKRSNSVSA